MLASMQGNIKQIVEPKAALAERIAADIRCHARDADLPAGAHLAEQEMADRFLVSRSPVREALVLLEQQGLVERRRHRGSFLLRPGRDLPDEARPMRVDDDADYARIAEDRLDGRLPERITEAALGRQYGLSRSRILTLLGRMQQEGWVERLPGHGWQFLPILATTAAYEDGYRFRAAIEPAALLSPGFVADPVVLGRLRAEQQALLGGGLARVPRSALFHVNAGYHEALVALSGNAFFIEGLRRVNRLRRLIEYRKFLEPERLVRQAQEHLAILDRIEAGDPSGAAALLERHLRTIRRLRLPDGRMVLIDPR